MEKDDYQMIRKTLEELGYPEYTGSFEDQRIKDSVVLLFTENELSKIIPEMGVRKQFFITMKNSEGSLRDLTEAGNGMETDSNSSTSFVFPKSPSSSFSVSSVEPTTVPSTSNDASNDVHEDCDNSSISSFSDGSVSQSLPHSGNAVHVLTLSQVEAPDFDIQKIITSFDPIYGQAILDSILSSKKMTLSQRKAVTNAAVQHLREISIGNHPNTFSKNAMALYLGLVFDFMPKECWYSKHPKKNATGYLEHRVGNLERTIRKTLGIDKTVTKTTVQNTNQVSLLTNDEYEERKQWLKDNRNDRSTMKKYLIETFSRRRVEIQDSGLNSGNWPCLFYDSDLINDEFNRLPQGNVSNLNIYSKLSKSVCQAILLFCKDQGIDVKPKLGIKCLTIPDESLALVSLSVLSYIFSNGAVITNKKRRKISNAESLSYFLDIFPVGTSIETLCQIEKKRTQPFIIILGNMTNCEFEQFFVMAERKAVVCNSFLHALDTCLKLYYVMMAEFPSECRDSWEFVNSFVYSLSLPKSTHLQLINAINNSDE